MTIRYVAIAALALIIVIAAPVAGHAVVLDFELGVLEGAFLDAVDPNYGDFTWDPNFGVINLDHYNSEWSNTSSFPSGTNAAFNGFGEITVEFGGQVVDLQGAWFQSWAIGDLFDSRSATSVTVEGYLGGSLVGSTSIQLSATEFHFLNTSFGSSVDLVKIISSNDEHWWLMDDLTYNSVPEPSTFILLGAGILGLGVLARLRKRQRPHIL